TDPDLVLQQAYPGLFFAQPTARPTRATGKRARCCASGFCGHCPIDSKFTILNEMMDLYRDDRVNLLLDAEVLAIEAEGARATGVVYAYQEREQVVHGDLIALGANAIFNPVILQRSN